MSISLDEDSDVQLVRRFAEARDERAFTQLVERHGPLVYSVALRMLRRREDAEDAFQATFLVFARRAASWRDDVALAAWLHGVAVRVCLNQRKSERRRKQRIAEAATMVQEVRDDERRDAMRSLVDEELAALPRRFREVLVMCDIEGFAREEVAEKLSLRLGTVSSRLARGRDRLKHRLLRHGIAVTAGGAALLTVAHIEAAATVPASLLETTVRHADTFVWGTAAAKSTLSLPITQLAEGVLRAMMITRCKTIVCFLGIVAASMFGGALAPGLMPEWTQTASANVILLEDFNDGSATDGNPRSWELLGDLGYGNGLMDASTGDLVLKPSTVYDTLIATAEPSFDLAELSVRARIRNQGLVSPTIHGTGLLINGNVETRSNIDFGIQTDGDVYVTIHDNGSELELGGVTTDLRPTIEDIVLQVDFFDGNINARAWRASEPMPSTPLITALSPLPAGGTIGIYTNPSSEDSSATFRYVSVADTHIVPEPGSRTLCAIGSGLLVVGLLFSGRVRPRFAR